MPFVQVHTTAGIMTADQRSALIDALTDTMVRIEGRGDEAFRATVWVQVAEHEPETWSLGGNRLSRDLIEGRFGKNR